MKAAPLEAMAGETMYPVSRALGMLGIGPSYLLPHLEQHNLMYWRWLFAGQLRRREGTQAERNEGAPFVGWVGYAIADPPPEPDVPWVATMYCIGDGPPVVDDFHVPLIDYSGMYLRESTLRQLLIKRDLDPSILSAPPVHRRLPDWATWDALADVLDPEHRRFAPELEASIRAWCQFVGPNGGLGGHEGPTSTVLEAKLKKTGHCGSMTGGAIRRIASVASPYQGGPGAARPTGPRPNAKENE